MRSLQVSIFAVLVFIAPISSFAADHGDKGTETARSDDGTSSSAIVLFPVADQREDSSPLASVAQQFRKVLPKGKLKAAQAKLRSLMDSRGGVKTPAEIALDLADTVSGALGQVTSALNEAGYTVEKIKEAEKESLSVRKGNAEYRVYPRIKGKELWLYLELKY